MKARPVRAAMVVLAAVAASSIGVPSGAAGTGAISGTVIDEGGQPVEGVSVWAEDPGVGSGGSTTDANGDYVVAGLDTGSYQVQFDPSGCCPTLALEYHLDSPGSDLATPVGVTDAVTTSGIDAELAVGGSISGTVTGPGGSPVEGVEVWAFGPGFGLATTGADGTYLIQGLWPGDYVVEFDPSTCCVWLPGEYHVDAATPELATPVTVASGVEQPGIDADLGPAITGRLRVSTSPPVPTRIVVDGVPRSDWSVDWVLLEVGDHEVCFTDVPGFVTPPCQTAQVSDGASTSVEGIFEPLGLLKVEVSPAGLPSTVFVDGAPANEYGLYTFIEPGDHEVCWGGVPGFVAPGCETASVAAGVQTTVVGTFGAAPGTPGTPAAPDLGSFGYLRVTTDPAVSSRIVVDGLPRNDWGLESVKYPVGSHEVCFTDVVGFTTPPCQQVTVDPWQTAVAQGTFAPLGLLKVEVDPAGLPSDVVVDGVARNQFGLYVFFEPGDHQVCFTPVAGYLTPSCESTTVTAGLLSLVTGSFVPE